MSGRDVMSAAKRRLLSSAVREGVTEFGDAAHLASVYGVNERTVWRMRRSILGLELTERWSRTEGGRVLHKVSVGLDGREYTACGRRVTAWRSGSGRRCRPCAERRK